MQVTNVGEGALRTAGELVEAYRRSCVLAAEIAERQVEMARLDAVMGARKEDPTFMALLHMLSGGAPDASPVPTMAGTPVTGASSPSPGSVADEAADAAGKAKRRSPDRKGPFEDGYARGEAAAREGLPRDLDGLTKGWRYRGFCLAYDKTKAGTPLDVAADWRATLILVGETAELEKADGAAPVAARAEPMPQAAAPTVAATEAPAAAHEGAGHDEAHGVAAHDDGFLPEEGGGLDPFDGDDGAGLHAPLDQDGGPHLPGWSAEPAATSASGDDSEGPFPFELPASDEPHGGHDLFQGKRD